mmetsp:Transcript_9447/g.23613  ORF Transcript_9447/g.23613 Transcript_9447/m.23613 type:complete len:192 (+) Transcript_9447:197-772(+)|eukprot:CAMPEP_0177668598 /NCGR_PEP_ID=MMETSP0447-20121125/22878_1 /TAXON_ID=0 /ORGANISM="Stygamoeba regulata, Strain BSH-02190019" /LENGTH=191 /DNA_ID=CAMNT_0019175179 /DNA_START=82 /DNA_END=657 /DNA_ORIENTATION=-
MRLLLIAAALLLFVCLAHAERRDILQSKPQQHYTRSGPQLIKRDEPAPDVEGPGPDSATDADAQNYPDYFWDDDSRAFPDNENEAMPNNGEGVEPSAADESGPTIEGSGPESATDADAQDDPDHDWDADAHPEGNAGDEGPSTVQSMNADGESLENDGNEACGGNDAHDDAAEDEPTFAYADDEEEETPDW